MMFRNLIIAFLACFAGIFISNPLFAQYSDNIQVEVLMKTDTTSIGQKIKYPKVAEAEVTVFKITMQPGATTGWHKHDIPLFAYVLQGTLIVEQENGVRKEFTAGSAVAEMMDEYHLGLNEGKEPLILVAFYLGGDQKPLAIRREDY
ncbi:MAG TPA: cupin domain-containing protein [Sphingobacteriaceae bacterium]|nr:cupin domain-containing protein [Sphingobacteriaceae bacterium]